MTANKRSPQLAAILVAAICCADGKLFAVEPGSETRAASRDAATSGPVDVAATYQSGAENFRAGRWAEAAADFRRLLATDAKHALAGSARFYLAESLVHTGEHPAAADAWLEFLAAGPDEALLPAARFRAGECCYLAGRRDDARRELARFLNDYPDAPTLPRVLLYLGNIAAAEGDFPAAVGYFGRSTAEFPDDEAFPQATLGHAQALLRDAEYRAAWSVIRSLYELPEPCPEFVDVAWIACEALERLGRDADAHAAAQRFLAQCSSDDPRRFEALLLSARLLERLTKLEEAAATYQQLVDAYPDHARRDVPLYEQAWILRQLGREADAFSRFETLAKQCPQSALRADALYRLAEQDLAADRATEASRRLAEAAAAAGDDLLPHILLLQARAALTLQQAQAAEAALSELKTKFPKHELAQQTGFWSAEIAFQAGRFDDAAEAFAALLQSPGAERQTWYATAKLRQVEALCEAGRWADVLAAVEDARRNKHAGYELEFLAARAHTARAELQEARAAYARVLADAQARDTETAAMAQFLTAETYFHQRNYEAALREYLHCDAQHKQPAWQAAALLQAGKCNEHLGRFADARGCYEELIVRHATSPYVADARLRREAVVKQADTAPPAVQRK